MPTEADANNARDHFSDFLQKLGAHAIAVDLIKKKANDFGVVAYFEEKPDDLPKSLDVKLGKKMLSVPLIAKIAEKFKPERL